MAFGTKIGEVYAEVFVKINESSRRAAIAGIAKEYEGAFNKAFDGVDSRSNKSTANQVKNQRTVARETKKATKDAEKDSRSFFQRLTKAGTQGEGALHRVATQFRTIGTLLRGLAIGGAVVGGINLLVTALQGVVALAPIAAAGLVALPAAVAAIGVEALILKVAFKGVGKAISDGLNPTKAKQFAKDMKALAPAARTFVKEILKVKTELPNIQQTFFSAPSLQKAAGRLKFFFAGIRGSLTTLVAQNGNTFGKIFGTLTNSSGAKLTSTFLKNIAITLHNITPGLQEVARGFQILITKVSGQGAGRSGGLNHALETFGHFLAHINVKAIFDAASRAINALKPALHNVLQIFIGIFKAIGGDQASKLFFDTITRFTGTIATFINSGQGKVFTDNLVLIARALGQIGGATILIGLQELSLALQVVQPLLSAIGKWARDNPGQFKIVAGAILAIVGAWKVFSTAVSVTKTALDIFRPSMLAADAAMNANVVGVIVVAIIALGVALFLLIKHFDAVTKFLRGPWGTALTLALVVLLPFIGIPLLIMAHFTQLVNFFKGPFLHGVLTAFNAASHGVLVVVNALIHWFTVSLPNAAKVLWANLVRYWNAIVGAIRAANHGIAVVVGIIARFFTQTIPGAAKWLWGQIVKYWNAVVGATNRLRGQIVGAFNVVLHFFTGPVYGGLKRLANFAAGIWKGMYGGVLRYFVNPIIKAFTNCVNAIKTIWGKVSHWIWAPIDWVKKNVYNNILVPLWNNVVAVLPGVGKINRLADGGPVTNSAAADHGRHAALKRAHGGHITGPGGPTQDLIPAMLSNGEYVIKASTVRQLGTSFFDNLNAGPGKKNAPFAYGDLGSNGVLMSNRTHLNRGGLANDGINYLKGGGKGIFGSIGSWVKGTAKVIGAAVAGGKARGQSATTVLGWLKSIAGKVPYVLGANGPNAFDCSSLVGSVWARLTGNNPNKRYFVTGESENSFLLGHGFKKGVKIKDSLMVGQNGEHTTGVLDGHRFEAAHTGTRMRFDDGATNAMNFPQKYWMPAAGGGGLLGGVLGFIEKLAGKGLQYMLKPLAFWLAKIPGLKGITGHKMGDLIGSKDPKKNMILSLGTALGNSLTKKADAAEAAAEAALAASDVSNGAPSNLVLGHGKFNSWMAQASRFTNIPAAWLPALLRIMQGESGGNPNAVNRSDSNARAGHPSQGLMQLIPSTYAHYVPSQIRGWGIRNPVANIAAAVNYIRAKYGTPMNTPWFHGQTFYNQGGMVEPKLFDQGGVLSPGYTLALNNTGHNEYVSTGDAGGGIQDLHVHFMDEHFVARVDDRIAKNNNEMIKYIITRHS